MSNQLVTMHLFELYTLQRLSYLEYQCNGYMSIQSYVIFMYQLTIYDFPQREWVDPNGTLQKLILKAVNVNDND